MILLGTACDTCTHHCRKNEAGKYVCDAFPDGLPLELIHKIYKEGLDLRTVPECNNGIKYEPDEERIALFK